MTEDQFRRVRWENMDRQTKALESIAASLGILAAQATEETKERKAMLADPSELTRYGAQIGRAIQDALDGDE